jgi:putative phosphoribosyl transferase
VSASNAAVATRIVSIGPMKLEGMLAAPENPIGLVIFAHGSGSSRLSPRNSAVALAFCERGLATLLFDLLTQREAILRRNVFDIELLTTRVVEAIDWARRDDQSRSLPIGLFGASTGAAAALSAAAERPGEISAVVSRGGRPDLAAANLPLVRAPTLLIIGGADDTVLALNEDAYQRMVCEKKLHVVPGATHLFEEEGALEEVVVEAAAWFCTHLSGHGSTR